jgi:hypothetical protein
MSGRNLENEFWFMKYCRAVQLDEGSAWGTECPAKSRNGIPFVDIELAQLNTDPAFAERLRL